MSSMKKLLIISLISIFTVTINAQIIKPIEQRFNNALAKKAITTDTTNLQGKAWILGYTIGSSGMTYDFVNKQGQLFSGVGFGVAITQYTRQNGKVMPIQDFSLTGFTKVDIQQIQFSGIGGMLAYGICPGYILNNGNRIIWRNGLIIAYVNDKVVPLFGTGIALNF